MARDSEEPGSGLSRSGQVLIYNGDEIGQQQNISRHHPLQDQIDGNYWPETAAATARVRRLTTGWVCVSMAPSVG